MKLAAVVALLAAPVGAFLTPHAPARFAQRGHALRSEPADAEAAPVAAAEPTAEAMAAASAAPPPRQGGRKPRGKPLTEFSADMMLEGEVKAVMKYGAFVDVGAASDGLVHISQLANEFVSDPTAIVSIGDKVTVKVLSVDTVKNQLALTMRTADAPAGGRGGERRGGGGPRMSKSQRLAERVAKLEALLDKEPSDFMTGKVADIQPFGAFVTMEGGIDGLVHISRMSTERVEDVNDVLTVGQEVQVRITEIDLDGGKLALAMTPYVEDQGYSGGGGGGGGYADDGYVPTSQARFGGSRGGPGEDGGDGKRGMGRRPARPQGGDESIENAFQERKQQGGRRVENPWLVAGDSGDWRSALDSANGVATDRWNSGGMIFSTGEAKWTLEGESPAMAEAV